MHSIIQKLEVKIYIVHI